MANNLSAAQRVALARNPVDLDKLPAQVLLKKGATTIDITAVAFDLGETIEEAGNVIPGGSDTFTFPRMTILVKNDDGRFSKNHADSIWGGPATEWTLEYSVHDQLSGTGGTLYYFDMDVLDCLVDGPVATISAEHKLARHWKRVWDRGDRQSMDWNGFDNEVLV